MTGTPKRIAVLVCAAVLTCGATAFAVKTAGHRHGRPRPSLTIRSAVHPPLWPGGSGELLNLRLHNRRRFALLVTSLSVQVRLKAKPGCRRADFALRQIPRSAFPLRIAARKQPRLLDLGVRTLPRLRMRNLPRNQDACKGARIQLRYRARFRRP